MKLFKFAFLLGILGVFFTSCLNDSRGDYTNYGYLSTTNVVAKEIKPAGEKSTLTVTYKTTNTCQQFVQIQLVKNENNTTFELGVLGSQTTGDGCTSKEEEKTQDYTFQPTKAGDYTFKFWAGRNTDNTDIFKEIKVTIPEKAQ
ncbi:hypothetical protein [Elizabethkingia meningoseptica]|uniref:hypothetical protein n=1 Tax=Elizabethkingia meningoseptica TaxID=238 RepID=UPI0038912E8E